MPDGDGYLAAAYLVFLALVLVYVAIMASRVSRLGRDIEELSALIEDPEAEREPGRAREHA